MSVCRRILKAWRRGGGAACRALAGPCAGHGPASERATGRRTAGGQGTGRWPPHSRRRARQAGGQQAGCGAADQETAELTTISGGPTTSGWPRSSSGDVARRFPALVGQAVRLGWPANRRDTVATITPQPDVRRVRRVRALRHHRRLKALFAAGPTPQRVRAALPSLVLVAAATAVRSGVATAAGLQNRSSRRSPRSSRSACMT